MISKTDVSSAGGTVIVHVKQRYDDVGVALTLTEARELHEQLGCVLARDDRRTALRAASKGCK